ncbi:coenzyme A pyrophosphatase [Streptococcus bovimastitidis]|uniref:Coenzyme A pyrophosphatase n=1 Tax=Streptococcus bovimastitidis TaxID=1856638 RepID=A0A1L8MMC2_9STRE|nr:CoA pyrophosphatase [Streptococcus bovimastitidis]OJF71898.1 coenzyme A pyrophosphatase [Streptococcus bovimastitidis]
MEERIREVMANYQPKPLGQQKEYAIFLPLVWDEGAWQVLYEVRGQDISQPGEVSFPGGRLEPGETFAEAALRECTEELNVSPDHVEIWGEIDYIVQAKRTIHCFVGQLHCDNWRDLKYNEEVDHLFTIPLNEILNKEPVFYDLPHRIKEGSNFPFERIRNGEKYAFNHQSSKIPFYEGFDETIWGLTAQFTDCFSRILSEKNESK